MIRTFPDLVQGSDEWLAARCGLITASEMKLVLTPKLKLADNDKLRSHLFELAAQRVTRFVEPRYISDDMLRGQEDEIEARALYARHYAPVQEAGFITNDRWGFTLGYSPDGLVGDSGLIECKSRRQKFQMELLGALVPGKLLPEEFVLQFQTGLLVSERRWLDFVSYSGGMPMATIAVYPDERIQDAIVEASGEAERRIAGLLDRYAETLASKARLIPTERKIEQEMYLS